MYSTPHFYNRSYLVIYGEYGYTLVGEVPGADELKKIQIKSEKHIELCAKYRKEMLQVKVEKDDYLSYLSSE